MATDTARVKLELASGRSEVTAPFQYTNERKRKKPEPETVTAVEPSREPQAEPPAAAQVLVDVPLADAATLIDAPLSESAPIPDRPAVVRPPWIAFVAALLAVAGAVWWVMFQRMPDLDPREIVQRNLGDARQAMADGRYTDPAERSALHFFSTVLALDPANADAVAGIDAIADRYLTDARVLLADQRVAEAGVALDKARRVRPDHNGLAELDRQWRGELKKLLVASTVSSTAVEATPAKATNNAPPPVRTAMVRRSSETTQLRELNSQRVARAAVPEVTNQAAEAAVASEELALSAALASVTRDPAPAEKINSAVVPESSTPAQGAPGEAASIDNSSAVTAAPSPLPERAPAAMVHSVEPKLIKMVQPAYPQEALMRGVEGWVEVSLQVNANGDVVDPRVEETSRGRLFNRAALAAIQQWKYEPRASSERLRVRLQFKSN